MSDPVMEFKRELSAAAERQWEMLNQEERAEILRLYDERATKDGLVDAIFADQWRRERGG